MFVDDKAASAAVDRFAISTHFNRFKFEIPWTHETSPLVDTNTPSFAQKSAQGQLKLFEAKEPPGTAVVIPCLTRTFTQTLERFSS
jgi:hypothetical protein